MSRHKQSSSQASWSILTEGVTASRVEAHRIRAYVNQLVTAIEASPAKEEIYRLCGDTFLAIPKSVDNLERYLDRTNYALITMGSDFYRQRLPHSDRELVDMAAKYNPTPSASIYKDSSSHSVTDSQGHEWGPRRGLEGPFLMRSGKVLYYDVRTGRYYDPTTDFYLELDEYEAHANPPRSSPSGFSAFKRR
jgi:hypothetical protein